jgi:hypothetical protein
MLFFAASLLEAREAGIEFDKMPLKIFPQREYFGRSDDVRRSRDHEAKLRRGRATAKPAKLAKKGAATRHALWGNYS